MVRYQNICYNGILIFCQSSGNGAIVMYIMVPDRNVASKNKYLAISPRPGAHVGERNLLLSAIRRGYRQIRPFSSGIYCWCHVGAGIIVTHIPVSDRNTFFEKKVRGDISPSACEHVGERNLLLSAIRRSYRTNTAFCRPEFWLLQVTVYQNGSWHARCR